MQHNMSTWSECLFAFFFGCLLFLVLCANGNKGILLFEDNVYFFLIFLRITLKIHLHHSVYR
jgi:hypothetical protein